MAGLKSRSITAALWGSGGSAVRIVLQLGTQVLLARLLGPEEFGVFAVGALVISFSNFFADAGVAYGLIQKKEVSEDDLRFVFTWQLIVGSLTTIVIVAASDAIAAFFGNAMAGSVVAALSVLCLLHALSAPSSNMLKRQLEFKPIQIGQIIGYIFGYIAIGLPMAMSGWGVWALVASWIGLSVVNLVVLYAHAPYPLKPLFRIGESTSFLTYGATVFVTNILNWVILNIDRTLVGRHFSMKDLGLYSTAYNVLYNPAGTLVGVIQPVFFSASAHAADDLARIRSAYSALLSTALLLFLPFFAFLAAASHTIILALYGSAWIAAADLFRPFSLAMVLYIITALTTPIIWTSGHGLREFLSQLPLAVLWVVACFVAMRYSAQVMAWTVFALYALRCVVIWREAIRATGIRVRDIWRAASGSLLLAACTSAATVLTDTWLRRLSESPWAWLAGDLAIAALVAVAVLRYRPSVVSAGSFDLLQRLGARLPGRVTGVFRAVFVRHRGIA